MAATPVIAIFDVGKTNKKLILFDAQYNVVYEFREQLREILDEDEDPCENIRLLTIWLKEQYALVRADHRFDIKALNFSGYGASLVYLDEGGEVIAPMYNYLKPYPEHLADRFYKHYGGQFRLCVETASPPLGSLNSGLQLYRIKKEQLSLFNRIKYALHLPQYLSFVFTGLPLTEITSVGCHTHLWDFSKNSYHNWVVQEKLVEKLPPISIDPLAGLVDGIPVGIGYHDSSAALIPYLHKYREPFLLLSTGTWCISVNPFNDTPLTEENFGDDCLCYLTPEGKQVKSSRLFAGPMHEQIVDVLKQRYGMSIIDIGNITYDPGSIPMHTVFTKRGASSTVIIDEYSDLSAQQYYHLGVNSIIKLLKLKIERLLTPDVKQIFVDGGFSQNKVFMGMLAGAFSHLQVTAASVPQASALGAALMMGKF
jgi:sugar (pentulose or hexulose) kinase